MTTSDLCTCNHPKTDHATKAISNPGPEHVNRGHCCVPFCDCSEFWPWEAEDDD